MLLSGLNFVAKSKLARKVSKKGKNKREDGVEEQYFPPRLEKSPLWHKLDAEFEAAKDSHFSGGEIFQYNAEEPDNTSAIWQRLHGGECDEGEDFYSDVKRSESEDQRSPIWQNLDSLDLKTKEDHTKAAHEGTTNIVPHESAIKFKIPLATGTTGRVSCTSSGYQSSDSHHNSLSCMPTLHISKSEVPVTIETQDGYSVFVDPWNFTVGLQKSQEAENCICSSFTQVTVERGQVVGHRTYAFHLTSEPTYFLTVCGHSLELQMHSKDLEDDHTDSRLFQAHETPAGVFLQPYSLKGYYLHHLDNMLSIRRLEINWRPPEEFMFHFKPLESSPCKAETMEQGTRNIFAFDEDIIKEHMPVQCSGRQNLVETTDYCCNNYSSNCKENCDRTSDSVSCSCSRELNCDPSEEQVSTQEGAAEASCSKLDNQDKQTECGNQKKNDLCTEDKVVLRRTHSKKDSSKRLSWQRFFHRNSKDVPESSNVSQDTPDARTELFQNGGRVKLRRNGSKKDPSKRNSLGRSVSFKSCFRAGSKD